MVCEDFSQNKDLQLGSAVVINKIQIMNTQQLPRMIMIWKDGEVSVDDQTCQKWFTEFRSVDFSRNADQEKMRIYDGS